jgi:hypothetical protein
MSLRYFKFEEDFIEDGMRCIPMIVRFKLDACGIKLKLSEWSKFSIKERELLSEIKCEQKLELEFCRNYLQQLVYNYTGKKVVELTIDEDPAWSHAHEIPFLLKQELAKYHWSISLLQWKSLTNLKRFALMKLCKPGHENKNFPKAIKEFGLAIN